MCCTCWRAACFQSRQPVFLMCQAVAQGAGRLEEAATAATGRDMTRECVMAVLIGRNTRFLIKRPSIIIGRSHAHSEKVRCLIRHCCVLLGASDRPRACRWRRHAR